MTLTVYARGSGAAATGVSVTAKELDMVPGQQLRVRSYVQPSTADQQVVWSSRDPEVATVDQNGVITAIANGGAVITVSTPDGAFTNRINVRVVDSYTGKPIFFTDVKEGDYCYDAVTWAYCQNMAESEDTTFFGAATPCTRLELVLYLWQLMGGPEPEDIYGPYFTDLPAPPGPAHRAVGHPVGGGERHHHRHLRHHLQPRHDGDPLSGGDLPLPSGGLSQRGRQRRVHRRARRRLVCRRRRVGGSRPA